MRWCVIRHPDVTDAGVVPEDSIEHYEARDWVRVSDWADNAHDLKPAQYPAPESAPVPELEPQPDRKPAKSSSKESS